jgi:hypothetical protein
MKASTERMEKFGGRERREGRAMGELWDRSLLGRQLWQDETTRDDELERNEAQGSKIMENR